MEAAETRAPVSVHAALVGQAVAGDPDAYGRLVELEWCRLVRLARSVVGDAEAEDAAQEGLVHGWRKLASLREPGSFPSWISRLVLRCCLRRARRRHPVVSLEDAPEPHTRPDPAGDLELERLLARLAPRQRAALHLTVVEGMADSEIAAVMGLSPASVRSHRRRAREALERFLHDPPRPEGAAAPGPRPGDRHP
jgi:RNA polymerase sigma-70 factor (ECF subfamily)